MTKGGSIAFAVVRIGAARDRASTGGVSWVDYDSDGNLSEVEYKQKGQMAMARVIPKRTGTYYLIVEIEKSGKERTHWGMAYGFK